MERITYRITLDAHKNGIQRTLQGFETADKLSRRIAINLVSSGDTYELPLVGAVAMMYVTTPYATEPSINACTIEGDTIIYDVLPIVEEGVTEMQLKVIGYGNEGVKKVLASPKFAVEVIESGANDNSAEQSTTFTAMEKAVALAQSVYDSRIIKVELEPDLTFRVLYADGTAYESSAMRETIYNSNMLLAESWAVGGTGIREGEDINNSKYYSNVSKSSSEEAVNVSEEAVKILEEAQKHCLYTSFQMDFENGELKYISTTHDFSVDQDSGKLVASEDASYDPDQIVGGIVEQFVEGKSTELDAKVNEAVNIAKGKNQAHIFDSTEEMNAWLSDEANKGICSVGDNLYIKASEVPDWWISDVLETADEETGFYYKIVQLETQGVDVQGINDAIASLWNSVPKSTTVKKIELVTDLPETGEEGSLYFTYEVAE